MEICKMDDILVENKKIKTNKDYLISRAIKLAEIEFKVKIEVEEKLNNIENEIDEETLPFDNDDYRKKRSKITNGYYKPIELFTDTKNNFLEDIFELEGGLDTINKVFENIKIGDKITVYTKRKLVKGTLLSFSNDAVAIRTNDRRKTEYSFRTIIQNNYKFIKEEEAVKEENSQRERERENVSEDERENVSEDERESVSEEKIKESVSEEKIKESSIEETKEDIKDVKIKKERNKNEKIKKRK